MNQTEIESGFFITTNSQENVASFFQVSEINQLVVPDVYWMSENMSNSMESDPSPKIDMGVSPEPLDQIKILIVDDEPHQTETLADIFRLKGFYAETANSGQAALDLIDQKDFDCVLSDIRMPGINGADLYREIKRRGKDIAVILMTAYASDDLFNDHKEKESIDIFSKPLNIDHLIQMIKQIVK